MTQPQTTALIEFFRGEQPVSTENLWGSLCIARKWNDWEELPHSLSGLRVAMGYLEARGYVLAGEDGAWRMKYPQPVERGAVEPQRSFAWA